MKGRQPVKGLKKQNGGHGGYRIISEGSNSGKSSVLKHTKITYRMQLNI